MHFDTKKVKQYLLEAKPPQKYGGQTDKVSYKADVQ